MINYIPPQSEDQTLTSAAQLAAMLENFFGTKCWDDTPYDTAQRVFRFWEEFVPPNALPFQFTAFPATVNQLIAVKNIEFASLCSHHLLPWYGKAHVAYIPNKLMVGLSKIPRLVDYWATRPCTQEWVTAQIASDLKDRLEAHGVAVIIHARHTCMACRGVRKHNGEMITSEMRGVFLTASEARQEFLTLITGGEL